MKEVPIHVATTALKDIKKIKVNLCTVAHVDFPDKQRISLIQRLNKLISPVETDWMNQDIQGVFFLSGGSEKEALNRIGGDRHVLLMAFAENNSFASAIEVKAYLDSRGIDSDLFNLSDSTIRQPLLDHLDLLQKVKSCTHKRFGLVGRASDWLVHSSPDPNQLRSKFGHRLVIIPWTDIPPLEEYPVSPEFLEVYSGYGAKSIEEHSRVYTMLTTLIDESELDGIAVECFPMIHESSMSACLSLALLNQMSIPAACEGDLVSLTGMFLVKNLIGIVPWMANLAGIYEDYIEISHCTVPLGMVTNARLDTHFETSKGLAIRGELDFEDCTILRLDQSFMTAFIAPGKIEQADHLPFACRTQAKVIMNPMDIQSLLHHPLGNHHILFPGNHTHFLRKAMRILNILVINEPQS